MRAADRAAGAPPARGRLWACADDLGVDAESDAIQRDLLLGRRLSGASVLVDGPNAAALLRGPAASADLRLGLHFNLTEPFGQPFAVRPLHHWLLRSAAGRLARDAALQAALRAEVRRQIERFAALAGGRLPDYLDGHQHVHGLAGVAEPLAQALADLGLERLPLRDVRTRRYRGPKAEVIARLCGRLPQALQRLNDDFVGVYGFDSAIPYETRVKRWMMSLEQGSTPMLMCHPGSARPAGLPYGAARAAEAAFLASEHWPRLLAGQGWPLA